MKLDDLWNEMMATKEEYDPRICDHCNRKTEREVMQVNIRTYWFLPSMCDHCGAFMPTFTKTFKTP